MAHSVNNHNQILVPPLNVNSNSAASEWLRWKRSVNLYITSQNITNDDQKQATVLTLGGIELQDIFFALPRDQIPNGKTKYEHTMDLLDAFFALKKNLTYERYIFRQIKQNPGESMMRYVNRLRQQANVCEFADVELSVCDQVVEGCSDARLREKYLKMPLLTVAMIEEKARRHEMQLTTSVQPEISSSSAVQQRSSPRDNDDTCPARGKECYYCRKIGHVLSACRRLKCNSARTMTKTSITSTIAMSNIGLVEASSSSAENHPIDDYDQDYMVMVSSNVRKDELQCVVGEVTRGSVMDTDADEDLTPGPKREWEQLIRNRIRLSCYKRDGKNEIKNGRLASSFGPTPSTVAETRNGSEVEKYGKLCSQSNHSPRPAIVGNELAASSRIIEASNLKEPTLPGEVSSSSSMVASDGKVSRNRRIINKPKKLGDYVLI